MSIDAYPLAWPIGWKRFTPAMRKRAMFNKGERQYPSTGTGSWLRKRDVSIADGCERVLASLNRMGCPDYNVIVSTNVPTTRSGFPRSGLREPDDPGAAVYWRDGEHQRVMAIDRYDRVADNLAAIAATLEAMRAIERHGGAAILDRAFTGFTALPGPETQRHWRETLGKDVTTREQLVARYKTLRSQHHPDRAGGSSEMFDRVQKAYKQASQELIS